MGNCVNATNKKKKSTRRNIPADSSQESTNVSHLGCRTPVEAEKMAIEMAKRAQGLSMKLKESFPEHSNIINLRREQILSLPNRGVVNESLFKRKMNASDK